MRLLADFDFAASLTCCGPIRELLSSSSALVGGGVDDDDDDDGYEEGTGAAVDTPVIPLPLLLWLLACALPLVLSVVA